MEIRKSKMGKRNPNTQVPKSGTWGTPVEGIRDYVKLAAPEPEALRLLGEESMRNHTSALNSLEIAKIIRKARSRKPRR